MRNTENERVVRKGKNVQKEEDEGLAGPQGEYVNVPASEIEIWCGQDGEGSPFVGIFLRGVQTLMTPAQARIVASGLAEAAGDAQRGALMRSRGMSHEEVAEALAKPGDAALTSDEDAKKFVDALTKALDTVLGRGPKEEEEANDGNTNGG